MVISDRAGVGSGPPTRNQDQRLCDHEVGQEEEDRFLHWKVADSQSHYPSRVQYPDSMSDGHGISDGEIQRGYQDRQEKDAVFAPQRATTHNPLESQYRQRPTQFKK